MPDKYQKCASKPSRRNHRRGSSSAGPQQPDHAHRQERQHPPNIDGCDSESEMDSETNRYNGTTSHIPSSDGYDPNNGGVVSHSGTHSSGSTLHHYSSSQRNDYPLPYDRSSGNPYSDAWGSFATYGAVNYGDPSFTVGRETTPTDGFHSASPSRVDGQYASSWAQDLRANDSSGEGLNIADPYGYSASRNVPYPSLGPYVGNEDPVPTDAFARVGINQPAQATADHSPPSSVHANNGSAQGVAEPNAEHH
ncbi:hypothetical protein DL764_002653 [Monosporascus ibericus]|uniref:Uncharacterized protein n=1 Tax=Monosporascus ibericus TaxID=155417 RepID=A0A4Q4TMX9_9PEZI|nr:hypothetical protein DL764_002653 [Monosporascus ibericus]